MTLTTVEQDYLAGRDHARLATVAPNGAPQNKPVGFRYNAELGTIDIYGIAMESSAKYRNVVLNPQVSFLADDVTGEGVAGARFLEIRGRADTVTLLAPPMDDVTAQIIRIHPRRVLSFNIDSARPGFVARDITPGD